MLLEASRMGQLFDGKNQLPGVVPCHDNSTMNEYKEFILIEKQGEIEWTSLSYCLHLLHLL